MERVAQCSICFMTANQIVNFEYSLSPYDWGTQFITLSICFMDTFPNSSMNSCLLQESVCDVWCNFGQPHFPDFRCSCGFSSGFFLRQCGFVHPLWMVYLEGDDDDDDGSMAYPWMIPGFSKDFQTAKIRWMVAKSCTTKRMVETL